MVEPGTVEIAERLSRRRARILPLFAILFFVWQANYFVTPPETDRLVDHVRISAWLVWAIVLLLHLASSGGLLRGSAVRALMNDESTRENRRTGYAYGFWAATLCAIGLYIIDMFEPVSGRDAVHMVLTAAIAAALLTFGLLERRALRDG
jgi:hypothetical protein